MIDNLTDAIAYERKEAEVYTETSNALYRDFYQISLNCQERANYHEQLATWLAELQERREADKWNVIHTEADLPKESDNYLIQLDNNWNEQLTAFFSKGVGFCFMGSVLKDVIAWRYLPEPYKESEAENE